VFKPFYVHEHHQPGKLSGRQPRGFTLKVSPDQANSRNVLVSGAWCSNKDEFNKRTGRVLADVAESKSINKRTLPRLLAEMSNVVHVSRHYHESAYYYILKFVV